MCGESWCHERSLTHRPSSQGWASAMVSCSFVCVVFVTLMCAFVWGGVSETFFLFFLHLFFAGVLCKCVSMLPVLHVILYPWIHTTSHYPFPGTSELLNYLIETLMMS